MRVVRGAPLLLAVAAASGCGETIPDEIMISGRVLYMEHCSACHRADGSGLPGTYPALDGSEVVTGPKREHVGTVLRGRPGTAMPAFRERLSDAELAVILTYERNAWKHSTGDIVSVDEVRAERQKLLATAEKSTAEAPRPRGSAQDRPGFACRVDRSRSHATVSSC